MSRPSQVRLASNLEDRRELHCPGRSRGSWLKVWFTTWIEREEHADTSLRGIETGHGSSRGLSFEGGPVLCLAIRQLGKAVMEALPP
jgi:hypothetical protein